MGAGSSCAAGAPSSRRRPRIGLGECFGGGSSAGDGGGGLAAAPSSSSSSRAHQVVAPSFLGPRRGLAGCTGGRTARFGFGVRAVLQRSGLVGVSGAWVVEMGMVIWWRGSVGRSHGVCRESTHDCGAFNHHLVTTACSIMISTPLHIRGMQT
jgi:hypothetical protein